MQTSIVFEPTFRRRGAKVSEGAPPVEESQASDSIIRLLNSVTNRFPSEMRISHHIYKSFSASKNNRTQRNPRLAFDSPLIL